jgi:hypothetical protein
MLLLLLVFFSYFSRFFVFSILSCALFYPMRAPLWVPHFPMFYTGAMRASIRFVTFFRFFIDVVSTTNSAENTHFGAPHSCPFYTGARCASTAFATFFGLFSAIRMQVMPPKIAVWEEPAIAGAAFVLHIHVDLASKLLKLA